ncbi:MAG: TetR/AcrR family transcriptional regulator [Bacteroides sp.]|nr:TetR/AcrR family transcriptional regulator [Bacillota bacterium]MCM1393875.1 TetR/AcrR family transcriptional regulator [[Eubacterium] siraeum]MCM1455982.1 TetR/AcrR family transcriptional regulator [Bacteroides sp.]
MSAKEDLRVLRTKKLLSDTLLDMMEHDSIEHISVMDLCNTAMVNRGTFYKHFEDKYSLLGYALEELKRDLYADFAKRTQYEDTPQAALRSFFETAIRFFENNSNRVANVVKNNMCGKVITAIEESISTSLGNLILKYTDRYTIKAPLPIITHYLAGGFVTTGLWCITNGKPYTYDEYSAYLNIGYLDPLFGKL